MDSAVASKPGPTPPNHDANMIARYLTPAWGPLPLKDITRTHIHDIPYRQADGDLPVHAQNGIPAAHFDADRTTLGEDQCPIH